MRNRILTKSLSTREITTIAISVCLLVAFLILKIWYLAVPYFWDESWVYGPAVSEMGNRFPSLLPGSIDIDLSRGHPMLFHFLGGLWGNIVGTSIVSLHSFALTISFALLVTLGYILYNKNSKFRITALSLGTVGLACQGVFLAQSAMVLPEVLVSLFVLLSLYLWCKRQYVFSAIFISACLLTKESGAVLFPSLGIAYLVHQLLLNKFRWSSNFKISGILIIALLPYLGFLIYQNAEFGWYFYPNHMDLQASSAQQFRIQLRASLNFILLDQNRVYLTLFMSAILVLRFGKSHVFWAWTGWSSIVLFIIYATQWQTWTMCILFLSAAIVTLILLLHASRKYYKQSHYLYLTISIFSLFYIAFTAFNFYSARYLLCLFPLYMLTLMKLAVPLLNRTSFAIVYFGILVFLGLAGLDRSNIGDTNLSFIDVGHAQKQMVEFLEARHQEDIILAPFLVLESLKKDYAGYKSKQSTFPNLQYSPDEGKPYLSIVSPVEGEYNVKARPKNYLEETLRSFSCGNSTFVVKRYYPKMR